ncbi:MAG: NAD-dependent epimerase/dehydratase family protein [Verrucomicrobiota bacterium]
MGKNAKSILILGGCGFVGAELAKMFSEDGARVSVIDNLSREGSFVNVSTLREKGVAVFHGDIREPDDLKVAGEPDWIVDAAANPSVLAGTADFTSRPLMMQNLGGSINAIEFAKDHGAGFILLSTSRVYNIDLLSNLEFSKKGMRFEPSLRGKTLGISKIGISEKFSTAPPISLYGSSKLASEIVVLEYSCAFDIPVFVNRCGVIAGAGQFGKPDQGIFSFWLNAHLRRRSLSYIGFDGSGSQVRDCLHPRDLYRLLQSQIKKPEVSPGDRVVNVSGGIENSMSLAELNGWCDSRWTKRTATEAGADRKYDLPWVVLDNSKCRQVWGWAPEIGIEDILTEIADHAEKNPEWMSISGVT